MVLTDKYCSNKYINSTQEFREIDKIFERMAKKTNAGLVKVGYAFELMKKGHPEIHLYGEENHPSKQGSYLIACFFFKYITGKNLQHVKYSADVDTKEALIIRKFADTIH